MLELLEWTEKLLTDEGDDASAISCAIVLVGLGAEPDDILELVGEALYRELDGIAS